MPQWVRDAFFYQIFPDRFRRHPSPDPQPLIPEVFEPWESPPTRRGFKGGNLWGVAEQLDYLEDLGVDALYLCPIFASTANHRYHTTDYFVVDPLLGGELAFRHLLNEAHRRNIRLVLDGVFNHCGRSHFVFQHLVENGAASPYQGWFFIKSFPVQAYQGTPNYAAWAGNRELPKFNTDHPQVRAYLFRVAEYWIEQGIDGWRLDAPEQIEDHDFWREFRQRVKAINPEAYLVGELWFDAQPWLQGDQFDGVMNYPLARAIWGFVGGDTLDLELIARAGLRGVERLSAPELAHALDDHVRRYGLATAQQQLNLLGSHDTPRLLTLLQGDAERVELAFRLLFCLPGAPMVYYGDEIGLEGGPDPDCRRAFPWRPEAWNHHLLRALRQAAQIRRAHPALRLGDYETLYAQGDRLAFVRTLGEERLLVSVNAGENSWQLQLPYPQEGELTELSGAASGSSTGGLLHTPPQPPRSLRIYRLP